MKTSEIIIRIKSKLGKLKHNSQNLNLQFHGEYCGIGARLWRPYMTLLVTDQLTVAALVALFARSSGYGLHADGALQATAVIRK